MKKRLLMLALYLLLPRNLKAPFGPCSRGDLRCLSCDSDSKCLLCAVSYVDESGNCQAPSSVISKCLFYSKDPATQKQTCTECVQGYKLIEGLCPKITHSLCLRAKNTVVQSTGKNIISIKARLLTGKLLADLTEGSQTKKALSSWWRFLAPILRYSEIGSTTGYPQSSETMASNRDHKLDTLHSQNPPDLNPQNKSSDSSRDTNNKPGEHRQPLHHHHHTVPQSRRLVASTDSAINATTIPVVSESCEICSGQILAHRGECSKIRFCSIENCAKCYKTLGKAEKCTQCSSGYVLRKFWNNINYCVPLMKNTLNCLYSELGTDQTTESCIICKINFYNKNGKCELKTLPHVEGYSSVAEQIAMMGILRGLGRALVVWGCLILLN